jgi:DNA-binding LacI/PurR family transcriptional regulator
MNDVATLAGVSIKTVSNVINGYPYIRSETKERVESAIRSLDYRLNVSARNLRAGRSRTITLAVPELTQPYFAELAQSVIDEAAAVDLTVFVETTGGRPERELAIVTGVQPILSDGLIFSPQGMTPDAASAIRPGVPMVLLGERVFHSPFDHVTMANEAAAEAAVAHLLDLGRRRVLLLGSLDAEGDDVSTGSLRMRGALNAFAKRGLAVDRSLISFQDAWDRPHGEQAIRALLASGTRFDAVFGMNDAIALGALRGLLRAGVSVPDDVAVVGFDDTLDAKYSTPSLTSISPGRAEIAKIAVELLNARLNAAAEDREHVELSAPFELMVRESTVKAA